LPFAPPAHVHQPLVQTIVNELRGTARCPSTGETALRTMRVMDTVLERYYGGREDEFWKRCGSWPGNNAGHQDTDSLNTTANPFSHECFFP
jgi:hypothetical protein